MKIDPGIGKSEIAEPPLSVVLDGLNDLLRLDHDAIGSYEIAVDRLQNRQYALQIQGFIRDHQSHIRRLNELIRALGGTPINEPHVTAPLKHAVQAIGVAGGDKGILAAWRANELQVMSKYDHYSREAAQWPAEAQRLIDANALDEERHYAWVVRAFDVSEPGVALSDRIREDLGTLSVKLRARAVEEIRSKPVRNLFLILATGFVAGRLLR